MKYSFLLIFLALLVACSNTTDSSSAQIEKPQDQMELSVADSEFVFNYAALTEMYYWQNELKEIEDYLELGQEYANYNTDYYYTYAMYETLSDNFTYYIPPEFALDYMNTFGFDGPEVEVGLGLLVSENLKVRSVFPESPASNAGMLRGDSIIAVDSVNISKKETFDLLTNKSLGDSVELTVLRDTAELSFKLAMAEIVAPTVFVDSIKDVPYIQITTFSSETYSGNSTYTEFLKALKQTQGAAATILDLRGNLGGDIDMCVNVTSELLSANDTILMFREKGSEGFDSVTYKADKDGLGASRYYVVLANEETASCSEMLIAAVTTNKQFPVIGSNTFGKGIGQYIFITYAYGIASITAMQAFDKNGESYHDLGFAPDYVAEEESEILAKALEFIEVEQKREAGFGTGSGAKVLAKVVSSKFSKPISGAYRIKNRESFRK